MFYDDYYLSCVCLGHKESIHLDVLQCENSEENDSFVLLAFISFLILIEFYLVLTIRAEAQEAQEAVEAVEAPEALEAQ